MHHNFAKIGEATCRISKNDPELADRIPEIGKVVGFRNVLIHDYDDIDPDVVWTTMTEDLPDFYQTVSDLLDELDIPATERANTPPSSGPKFRR